MKRFEQSRERTIGRRRDWGACARGVAVLAWALAWFDPVRAQEPSAEPSATLETVHTMLKNGEYEAAIAILKPRLAELEPLALHEHPQAADVAMYRDVCLLLVRTYAFAHNANERTSPDVADLQEQEARRVVERCLAVPSLRATQPDSVQDPPLVHDLFRTTRAQKFGAFRVVGLEPADAVVSLGDEPLAFPPGESLPGEAYVPVGTYEVVVRREGYEETRESVVIEGGTEQLRSFQLDKNRGWWWWTWRGGLAAGAVTGLVLGLGGEDAAAVTPLAPLPDPPAPPGSR